MFAYLWDKILTCHGSRGDGAVCTPPQLSEHEKEIDQVHINFVYYTKIYSINSVWSFLFSMHRWFGGGCTTPQNPWQVKTSNEHYMGTSPCPLCYPRFEKMGPANKICIMLISPKWVPYYLMQMLILIKYIVIGCWLDWVANRLSHSAFANGNGCRFD